MAERNTQAFRAQLKRLPGEFDRIASRRMATQVIRAIESGRAPWPVDSGRSLRSFDMERQATGRVFIVNRTRYAFYHRQPLKAWVRRHFAALAKRARALDSLDLSR